MLFERHVAIPATIIGLLAAASTFAQTSIDDLSGPWQLFVDDYPVESKTGVIRTYHAFEKYAGNPVITGDRPWEGNDIYVYGTVARNESGPGYRLWYHSLDPASSPITTWSLYATSDDGINWNKPNLGNVAFEGSTENNIFMERGGNPSVIHTPWDPDPAKRYKLVSYDASGRFFGSWSADAIHWTDSPLNPIVPPASDVGNFNWDPHSQRYFGYLKVRGWLNGLKRRGVGFSATTDFESWPAAALILSPDAYDDRWASQTQATHFYGLCGFAYESMYIGFLWIFRATDVEGYYDGPVFVELVSSHDGINWIREEAPRPPLIPNGPAGSWDAGMIFTTTHPLVEGNTIRIYYGGMQGLHQDPSTWLGAIGMATLRKDGFASLDAGATTASVTTRKISGADGPLHVNYRALAGGWLKVEVLDEAGAVLPGYSAADCTAMQGDAVDQVVVWASHNELPAGTGLLQLRFVMENASLYSFAAGEAVQLLQPPTITEQPVTQNACPGGTIDLSVAATSTDPVTYQWRRNSENLSDAGHYTGTTSPVLTVSSVNASDVADYTCVLSTPGGSATTAAATIRLRTASFTGIGIVSQGTSSTVTGISADGSVVCGTAANRAFIWTTTYGRQLLTPPSGASTSSAAGVGIYKGNIVVAADTNASTNRARRWDGAADGTGTWTTLPRQDGTLEWVVKGLGTNGTTDLWIPGYSVSGGAGNGRKAGRYKDSSGQTTSFQLPSGGHDSSAFNAASDTGVYAGQYRYGSIAPYGSISPMRNIAVPLETLLGPRSTTVSASVSAVSRDGLTLAGWSYYAGGGTYWQPTIWGYTSAPAAIPFIAGGDNDNFGEVLALNGDGTIAGGYSYAESGSSNDGPREAFLWDAAHGTRRVQDLLSGQDLSGWSLQEVRAMSADGTVVAGTGLHNGATEGWVAVIARIPPVITTQPQSHKANVTSSTTFSIEVMAYDLHPYQWQRNGQDLTNDEHFSGTTTSALTITNVATTDAGDYRCVLAHQCSTITSSPATLTVATTVPSDFDEDNDVDQDDFAFLQRCFSGAFIAQPDTACAGAKLDKDSDVDGDDLEILLGCLNGANRPPACLP